jgi:membrane-associated phospholipid phosphatase
MRVSIPRLAGWAAWVIVALEGTAQAEPSALAFDLDIDGPITLAGGLGWLQAISLRQSIGPAACRLCGTNSFDLAARNALLWRDPLDAGKLANVVGFAIAPTAILSAGLLAAWHDDVWPQFFTDGLLVVEAGVVASDINLAVRFSVARERPWAYALSSQERANPDLSRDANMSFYSGHATFLFALATAGGTIATMRGYRWTPLVWLVGVPFALATSYFRVASDDHWMTDVLVGVAAGTGMGFAIPYFAHKRVKIVPAGGTVSLVGSF